MSQEMVKNITTEWRNDIENESGLLFSGTCCGPTFLQKTLLRATAYMYAI